MLGNVYERLPFFTKAASPKSKYPNNVTATKAYLFSRTENLPTISLNDAAFSSDGTDLDIPMKDWQIKIGDSATRIDDLWLVVRYKL